MIGAGISIKNLSKSFLNRGNKICVLDNAFLDIYDSKCTALLGNNGAGKTTLLKCISGLIVPQGGKIFLDNKEISWNSKELRQSLFFCMEGTRWLNWKLTVRENIEYWAGLSYVFGKKVKEQTDYWLESFDLKNNIDSLVENLSRGMQQKVAICCGLVRSPRFLLLDEPTLGLDFDSRMELMNVLNVLKNNRISIVLSSHDVDFVKSISDNVYIMKNGKILENDEMICDDFTIVKIKTDVFVGFESNISSYSSSGGGFFYSFDIDNNASNLINFLRSCKKNNVNISII